MPSRKIDDCHPELRSVWPVLKARFEERYPGWQLVLTCTHRTPAEQLELYKRGRKLENGEWVSTDKALQVTWTLVSRHTKWPAEAFDFAIVDPDQNAVWDYSRPQWRSVPSLVSDLGVESGATWKHPDFPHIQIKD